MKAKHIITTCGVILGGLAVAGNAGAIVTYQGSSDVQFTFNPVLTLALSADGFTISELAPGTTELSNGVTATVSSNSSAGYVLNATVGNSTYQNTDLTASNTDRFAMMNTGATTLSKGSWGYTIDNGTTYKALPLYTSTTPATIVESTNPTGSVSMKIGAYAKDTQLPGAYSNVVNFEVISRVMAHTLSLTAGANVSSVAITSVDGQSASGTSGDYGEGSVIGISATCASGATFSNWGKSVDFGTIANANVATTTYTVGAGNVALTAYCTK